MRMSRRAVLHGAGGNKVTLSYTGTHDLFGDSAQGFAVLKTAGTLTVAGTVDLCLVGGGGHGSKGWRDSGGTTQAYNRAGGGGAGGYVSNYIEQDLDGIFSVTIGAGSTSSADGGTTSVGAAFSANGGKSLFKSRGPVTGRGTGGTGGSGASGNGTNGEDGIYPFDDAANFADYRVSGCGGGGSSSGSAGLGGAGGGGDGGKNSPYTGEAGTPNTGGGGGGGKSGTNEYAGGNGGSGVVFVRWGYTH